MAADGTWLVNITATGRPACTSPCTLPLPHTQDVKKLGGKMIVNAPVAYITQTAEGVEIETDDPAGTTDTR